MGLELSPVESHLAMSSVESDEQPALILSINKESAGRVLNLKDSSDPAPGSLWKFQDSLF